MEVEATLSDLAIWIRQYPGLLVLITGLGPLLLGLIIERIGRSGPADAEALAPPVETQAEAALASP